MNFHNKLHKHNRWLLEHFNDEYVKASKIKKVRSRAWFKLQELDIKNKLFKKGMNVIDLGASPGSWSQYACKSVGIQGRVIACDIIPMMPIVNVKFFRIDCYNKEKLQLILQSINFKECDLVMSDMAPNITGNYSVDMPRIISLGKTALKISRYTLSKNGIFLLKSFQGEGFNEFYRELKIFFSKVKICKPKTSRARSREIFILATR